MRVTEPKRSSCAGEQARPRGPELRDFRVDVVTELAELVRADVPGRMECRLVTTAVASSIYNLFKIFLRERDAEHAARVSRPS